MNNSATIDASAPPANRTIATGAGTTAHLTNGVLAGHSSDDDPEPLGVEPHDLDEVASRRLSGTDDEAELEAGEVVRATFRRSTIPSVSN